MKNGIYTCVILMAFLALSESVYAVIPVLTVASDTIRRVVIYFDKEETDVDFSYKTNNQEINVLDSLLEERINSRYITALNVVTFVSPDGDSVYNAALSVRRNNSMREFLRQRYPYVDVEKIKLTSEGEDWSELRKLVASDSDLPDREEVLMLIDYHRDNIVKRKELLQKLNQGMAYRYIVRNVLPKLRRAEITVVREVPEMEKNTFEPVSSVSGLFVSKQEEALPSDQPDKPEGESKESKAYEVVVSEAEGPVESKTVLAVKNNLLYDLALAPNLEIEIPVGRRWSLNAEYKCPWWLNSKHNFCYQLLSGGVEVRCWLGNRNLCNRLTGYFLGLYTEGGVYDFQLKEESGIRGKYYMTSGLSCGYARRITGHLAIECSLGIGYLTTEYCKYTSYQGELVRTNGGHFHFVGPTKVAVSLVWHITAGR